MTDPRFIERIKVVQIALGFSGADVDGKIGHHTLGRIEARLGIGQAVVVTPAEPVGQVGQVGGVDDRTARNVATLLPGVRPYFEQISIEGTRIARELGADRYVMISGTRTYAEQDALYSKGRTAPGPKVTNARGGYSNHNFGIAGDFGVFDAQGRYLDSANPGLASRVHVAVAKWVRANLPQIEWGGDWTSFPDQPHYQHRTGLSMAEMRARVAAGKPVV